MSEFDAYVQVARVSDGKARVPISGEVVAKDGAVIAKERHGRVLRH